jgi:hypothetical protein
LEFIYPPLFEATAKGLLDEEALHRLELALLHQPEQGAVIGGTGGVRKVRVALPGRGKRSGARVIYFFVATRGRVYLLLACAKNRKVDVTPAEKRALYTMSRELEQEA